ncbi:DUF393 domain-containing protein [Pseudoclavibacter chungangensis]|uniref:DUF393 domain-containing protein n=1 Tax=Pseudoclavibacter chungangensis TaxID=587635 RepID=A0A7J5BMJ9_9MICO|nr:DCC1-like thiol-disulfide oxidoreductase family protein [Pseudoclavibacter chungangensis]KAB1652495.1 DUF393 domain-containing protein [Pseudoclavibacter chungangensis]NYJ66085.1 putative DCC family thiol-disulfide oxidoreductase YuxK [Pseudoclavibacter chungangensis]
MSDSWNLDDTAGNGHRRPVLVYDGDCGFCSWSVERAREVLPALPEVRDGRRTAIDDLYLDPLDVDEAVWVVREENGVLRQYRGADAVFEVLRRQPAFVWRFIGNLATVPGIAGSTRVAYEIVKRNRHRLPGGTTSCALPHAA